MLRKELGYLPQDFGVYPNMTPVEFLEYMAAMKGLSKASARKRIDVLLEDLHLTEARKRKLGGFSGGMKQRAALLRTYLFSEKVALLDEPFSALDMLTKGAVHEWYLDVMEKIRLSTLFITHDIDEAIL